MQQVFSVSDFLAVVNQTFEFAYPSVEIIGEVASFKVNQDKFVFFDLKDAEGSVGCFMTVWQLRIPIEDGMKVVIRATPKLTQWGKFSLTVTAIRPSGEGSLKKSFELLKAKLEKEGLFSEERKRPLPRIPRSVAVISSTQAAGYADFIKILDDRWGGLHVDVAHVQVQGEVAADQIIRAIKYFNEQERLHDVLVIIRGGGSADDLSVFNDELLVRELAVSRIPTLVGVGHEVDVTLADLAADVRAATPSAAAQILVPDRQEVIRSTYYQLSHIMSRTSQAIEETETRLTSTIQRTISVIDERCSKKSSELDHFRQMLSAYDPMSVLKRGYAIVRGVVGVGRSITIEQSQQIITAEVKNVEKR